MAQTGMIVDPTVPAVTWENLNEDCLRVRSEVLNLYLDTQVGKFGLKPIYEPYGHRSDYLEVFWFPKWIAQAFLEKFRANEMSVDPKWPDEDAMEVAADCRKFYQRKSTQHKKSYDQQCARHQHLVESRQRLSK